MTPRDLIAGWTEPSLDAAEPVERSGVRVGLADGTDRDAWDDYVERSPQGTVFHRLEALRAQRDHSGTTLCPLVGYKGQEPVGIFPLFAGAKAGFTAAFSPAPGLWISSLGPALLNLDGMKRRRAEKRHRRFVGAALEWVRRTVDPAYVHVSAARAYRDPRPFEWNDYTITPRHTYVVDLSPGADALLESFSSDARRNVGTDDDGHEIAVSDEDAIRPILEQVRARYEQQDKSFSMPTEFALDLRRRLPEGAVRPYVCRVDGEFVGGMIVVVGEGTVHRWHGGAKVGRDLPINDLLDWRIIRDAASAGHERYDMEGANVPRLCGYKSKFAPEVVPYYRMERGSMLVRMGRTLYTEIFR